MKRTFLSSAAVLALGLSLGGCATLRNSPEVAVAPSGPVQYRAEPAAPAVTGSLFSPVAYRPAFEDPRARLPGDTLTIQIAENVTASQKSSSTIDRAGDVSSSVTAAPFMKAPQLAKLDAAGSSTNTFSGKARAAPKAPTSSKARSPPPSWKCCPTVTCWWPVKNRSA